MIRKQISDLFDKQTSILADIEAVRSTCPHTVSVYSAHGSSGHWDRDDSYWYEFYCYDCRKRWTTDQSYRKIDSMKVDKIDYSKDAKIVELEMQIEAMR